MSALASSPSVSGFPGSPRGSISGTFGRSTMIDDFKKKIQDLEAKVADRDAKLLSVPDIDGIKLDAEVTKKNNEILQGNVDTMKALSVQLAQQLEEANLMLATFNEKKEIATLQLERDVTYEIDTMRRDYEGRLTELRRTLEEAQMLKQQEHDQAFDREAKSNATNHQILLEKDCLINSLTTQVEVLKNQLEVQLQQQKEQNTSRSNATKMKALRAKREQAAFAGAAESTSYEGPTSSRFRQQSSQQEAVSEMKNVLALTLSVDRSDFEVTRRIRGVGVPPLQGGHHFPADMASDPSILVPSGEDGNRQQQHLGGGGGDNRTAHAWSYRTVSGDNVFVSLVVESSSNNATE